MKAHDRATALYRDTFQHSPEGVWSAPGRVNLIGEHTDYNDGFVLPIALESRTAVAVGLRPDRRIVAHSESEGVVAEAALGDLDAAVMSGWAGYVLGLVWALEKHGIDVASMPGLSLAVASDVPTGAGLSSSAALECAVAMALNDVWNLGWNKQALAALGQQAENEVVGANTGIMDQSVSMFGAEGHAVFLDCR
ncbi:MAG: galactokinase, partial [Pontimonas sp.]